MRTPPGRDCTYYYEDLNRGAHIQVCRVARHSESDWWVLAQCRTCPVPGIQAANGNPYLNVILDVRSGWFGRKPRFEVEAWCVMHGPIEDAFVGCVECAAEQGLDLEGPE